MKTRHIAAGTVAGALLLLTAPAAPAAVPVDFRVEGQTTIIPPTTVQAPDAFTRDGKPCAGPSPVGALDVATAGDWSGNHFDGYGWSVETIKGESHAFGSGAFWANYVNGVAADFACQANLVKAGDEVAYVWVDDPFTAGTGGPGTPLYTKVPSKTAPLGQPFTVEVRQVAESGQTPALVAGATVAGGGATATSGADGKATLTLTQRGPVELKTTKGDQAPDRDVVCVTDGADGFCGTTAPGGGTTPAPATTTTPGVACQTSGSDGFCGTTDRTAAFGFVTAIEEGERFRRGRGPRTLRGRVAEDPSGLRRVTVRLTRNAGRGRCSYYSGRKETWVKTKRCSATAGFFFKAAETADWSYLLPEKLAAGRYVFDVRATDGSGNADTRLARGRNRVVFHVG